MNRDGGPAVRWSGIGGLREAREASQSACVDAQKTFTSVNLTSALISTRSHGCAGKNSEGLPNFAMVVGLRAAANFARLSSCTLPMAVCHSVAGKREFWTKNGVTGNWRGHLAGLSPSRGSGSPAVMLAGRAGRGFRVATRGRRWGTGGAELNVGGCRRGCIGGEAGRKAARVEAGNGSSRTRVRSRGH